MSRFAGLRLREYLSRLVSPRSTHTVQTEVLEAITERTINRVLDLAMRISALMLAVGAPSHEATLAATRVARAYGLKTIHVNVTFNSITVSYHRGDENWPTTLMRVVSITAPDYAKLQRLQTLMSDIEAGLDLGKAITEYRTIRRMPFAYGPLITITAQALLAVGVSVMFGGSAVIMALTFIAAFTAALTQAGLAKTGLPVFFNQIAGGFAVTIVAVIVSALGSMGIEIFVGIRPSVIVISGIMMMLAGMAVVGAMQDAIDGFALTAVGRILDLIMRTLGVVLGILFGLELGRVLGYNMVLSATSPAFGPLPLQLIGAMIVAFAVAVISGARIGTIAVSGLLSIFSMIGFDLAIRLDFGAAAASGVGALLASFVGSFIAHRFPVPSVAIITAAIIPLVPGAAVFRGLLSLVQSDSGAQAMLAGSSSLVLAATTGIALATGASLGLIAGTPVRATLGNVVRSRAGLHQRPPRR